MLVSADSRTLRIGLVYATELHPVVLNYVGVQHVDNVHGHHAA
jgi:hypothetical protein